MNIALFSAVRYDSVIGGRTRRLCGELSRRHSVHFIEMPSLRCPCFSRKIKLSEHLFRYQLMPFPRLWDHFDSAWGQWWIRQIGDFLIRNLPEGTDAIVSTPFWAPVLKKLKLRSVTYDCLDHLSVQAPGWKTKAALQLEQDLIAMADRVVCVSRKLADAMRKKTQKPVHIISNGFSADYLQSPVTYPSEPTAGFCGAMYEWFDFSLVRDAAQALPDVHFILTGPVRNKKDLRPLHCLPNVELNPAISFDRVKTEIMRYSVGMIPFKRDTISYFCNPIKMYEYSALGRSVVSTVRSESDLPVAFAEDSSRFISALDRLVHAPAVQNIKRETLSRYTWNNSAEQMERILI